MEGKKKVRCAVWVEQPFQAQVGLGRHGCGTAAVKVSIDRRFLVDFQLRDRWHGTSSGNASTFKERSRIRCSRHFERRTRYLKLVFMTATLVIVNTCQIVLALHVDCTATVRQTFFPFGWSLKLWKMGTLMQNLHLIDDGRTKLSTQAVRLLARWVSSLLTA